MDEGDLLAVCARAAAERPTLAGIEGFREHLRALGEADAARLHAGDLLLAFACLRGDDSAIAAFDRELVSQVPRLIARVARDPDAVAEVQQQTRCRVLVAENGPARLADYRGRGPLGAWLRVVALRVALDLEERRGARVADGGDQAMERAALGDDLELEHLKARYGAEIKAAFSATIAALDRADRTLLRFAFLDGLTVNEMAAASRQHRTTVMRNLQRVRDHLVSEVRRRVVELLRCGQGEADELTALVRSRLELSLSRLLG